ncbi:hypothetical protein TSTA_090820 [Talaromyces stipitatus ATCC 10500]|uniref:Cytochrome P450 n=1 Tax=Talaromyces stipitatus (strain ATCC 10500 / CBS 375.48 / QM 6759 / NRRL 1006) TaxID=441959 RepID=B8M1E6_TALSN|nr:uncharacterized protein TSTA_090820 [Talaromyces stipitatus ATCC 10500]EED21842.1 hypothetical protein TSTA_090820 [Talaromyces stipitatus ATCC 10500]
MEIVHAESVQLLRDILVDHDDGMSMDHPKRSGGSVMTSILYGVRASPIDAVVGEERVPTLADYKDLPYVAVIVKEHYWIDGKLLPRGTTLILNIWGLHHDET